MEREHTRRLPALPGTPDMERAEILARVQGEPVLFIRPPRVSDAGGAVARSYRRSVLKSPFPWDQLKHIAPRFAHANQLGRDVLLREGYLYAEAPELALALYEHVELRDLFGEPELWIERGNQRLRVTKNSTGKYVYADGAEASRPARLLLFDRVGRAGETFGPPLHRDLRTLAYRLGFDRVRVEHITENRILAELRYERIWVPSVLRTTDASVDLDCEIVPEDRIPEVALARVRTRAKQLMLRAMQNAMLAQVREALPFDEPRRERGQQDGYLRFRWLLAYFRGQSRYSFNGLHYDVFTAEGRPNPPQVCIDFITETFERAAGTWWQPRGALRARKIGLLDFDRLLSGNRRQVESFIDFAQKNPAVFEVRSAPPEERVQFKFKRRFFGQLLQHADDYAPGDTVVIRGYTARDRHSVPHYHTFFVYEKDPLSGMPMLLADNAGKPRIHSWESVMARTPLRSIQYRIRPKLDWTESIVDRGLAEDTSSGPPPLLASAR